MRRWMLKYTTDKLVNNYSYLKIIKKYWKGRKSIEY